MIEFEINGTKARVGFEGFCEECFGINMWDGVCSDCSEVEVIEDEIDVSLIKGLNLDDMDDTEQKAVSKEFGFDLQDALEKADKRAQRRNASHSKPYRIYGYHLDGSVCSIVEQNHPNKVSARKNLPSFVEGMPYKIFDGSVAITSLIHQST